MLSSAKAAACVWSFQNVRCLSTTTDRLRGFVKSTTASLTPEARQRLIDRKKRRLAQLEKRPVRKVPITDFEVLPEWANGERYGKGIRTCVSQLAAYVWVYDLVQV